MDKKNDRSILQYFFRPKLPSPRSRGGLLVILRVNPYAKSAKSQHQGKTLRQLFAGLTLET